MAEFYIECTKTETAVYRVEAKNAEEAKEKVKEYKAMLNIVDRKHTENYRVVNGMYKFRNLPK